MRSRDLHILTSGNFSFSSDARFGPQHTPGSDAWTLRLDNAKKTDSGKYECQVNTEPKIMYAVQLSVRGDCRSTSHFVLHVCSPSPPPPSHMTIYDRKIRHFCFYTNKNHNSYLNFKTAWLNVPTLMQLRKHVKVELKIHLSWNETRFISNNIPCKVI